MQFLSYLTGEDDNAPVDRLDEKDDDDEDDVNKCGVVRGREQLVRWYGLWTGNVSRGGSMIIIERSSENKERSIAQYN